MRPIHRLDGYLPLEDFGLIGDGSSAALVGRDGSIPWLCLPRFDSSPLFCGILDEKRGGSFTIAPIDLIESEHAYEEDTAILITEMRSQTGVMRLTDAMTLQQNVNLVEDAPATRRELLRSVQVLSGRVRLRVSLQPRGGATAERRGGGLRIRVPHRVDLNLHLTATRPLPGLDFTMDLEEGERVDFLLRWSRGHYRHHVFEPDELLKATREGWRKWIQHFTYHGPQTALVRRSAVTLKALEYLESGAIIAAPTSSLPEVIGGPRNWDYRFSWIRDAAFSVFALHRIGFSDEAAGFLGWVLDAVERGGKPKVMYTLDGDPIPREWEDRELSGYRGSRPVRWGNGASEQVQHDVYGEIMDCAYQWAVRHGEIDEPLWVQLQMLANMAKLAWQQPDQGIWEVRTPGRPFTYSAALCQVALDRAARIAERFSLPGPVAEWRSAAEEIRSAIMELAWDERAQSLTEHLGGGGIDASLLALPLRRVIDARDPRMVATTGAVVRRLGAGNGLLFRYLPDESPDGVAGHEGAFLLCSFWLVDNLANQGRLQEASDLYDSLCSRANRLGLLPEQIDPSSGAFLGNFPQAFSHVGIISSGWNLERRRAEVG